MLALAEFAGLWTVRREVDDRRNGVVGRFLGSAILRPDGERLRYCEAGSLRMGDGPILRAERRYVWRSDGDAIAVLFADGSPFHRFRAEGRALGTDHVCGADLYRVTYDFAAWPEWTARWDVRGPAKDYVLSTRYARVPRLREAASPATNLAKFRVQRLE